jgi:uncharacterized protein GlcG (DUF336 family)
MMRPSDLFPVLMVAMTATATTAAEPGPPPAPLSLPLAMDALGETIAACTAEGYKVAVTFVDLDGVMKLEARGDGSPIHSQRFSFRKAYTIASMGPMFGVETGSALVAHLRDFPGGLANVQSGNTDLLLLPGSAVIKSGGVPIGAIGVSGAPSAWIASSFATGSSLRTASEIFRMLAQKLSHD